MTENSLNDLIGSLATALREIDQHERAHAAETAAAFLADAIDSSAPQLRERLASLRDQADIIIQIMDRSVLAFTSREREPDGSARSVPA